MTGKTVNTVIKYVGSYARAMAERHSRLQVQRQQDLSLKGRWYRYNYSTALHRQCGLLDDDQLYETYRDHVREGVSRLPREEQEMRVFRTIVAAQVNAKLEILPKDEHTTEATNRPYAIGYVEDASDEMHAKLYWKHQ